MLVPHLELNKLPVAKLPKLARLSKPVKLNVFKASKPSRSQAPRGFEPGLLCFYLMVGREGNKMLLTALLQMKPVLIRVNQASSEALCLCCQDL